jgi:predicted MFS family arabinose efflux permease
MLAQLSQRSDEETRGTGLAYFSVAFALGMIIGASGGGLLYQAVGYSGLLRLGAVFCFAAVLVLLRDRAAMQVGVRPTLDSTPGGTNRTYVAPG